MPRNSCNDTRLPLSGKIGGQDDTVFANRPVKDFVIGDSRIDIFDAGNVVAEGDEPIRNGLTGIDV